MSPQVARVVLVSAVVVIAVGCSHSGSAKRLTSAQTVAALRTAGVPDPARQTVGREQGRIVTQGAPRIAWRAPIFAVWLQTSDVAKRTYDNGYGPAALKRQAAEARASPTLYAGLLPQGFPDGIEADRVCNVILVSSNPGHDAALEARAHSALKLLQDKCK